MGYTENLKEVHESLEAIKTVSNEFQLYDWDEILDHVPYSESLKEEILYLIQTLTVSVETLEEAL